MNDPATSRRGILEGFSSKSRGKPRGIKPTGGIEFLEALKLIVIKKVFIPIEPIILKACASYDA